MRTKNSPPKPRRSKPVPVIPAPASILPGQFTQESPMSDDRLAKSEREAVNSMSMNPRSVEDQSSEDRSKKP
jgi:hypothetical protein